MTSSFYECSFFQSSKLSNLDSFVVKQDEIIMDSVLEGGKVSFIKKNITYRCSFKKQKDFSSSRPTILIPTKDNSELLKYTIANLQKTNVVKHANVLIIDDRSGEDLRSIVQKNNLSYLRVDNDKGFNFSMLNNIAAKLCSDLGNDTIILWNSDLWCAKEEYFLEVLKRHKENGSTVSGTKLLYPSIEMSLNKEIDSENIKNTFPHLAGGKWRETVQFGGDIWIMTPRSPVQVSPLHFRRFSDKQNPMVNCDRGSNFVTGAFQIWNLSHYMNLGGLNPSLAKNFQDVDMCLKAVEAELFPLYFGKDIFFYHDESLTMHNLKGEKKNDKQMSSDHYLFAKLWNDKLLSMVF